jgi:hypothetical protein
MDGLTRRRSVVEPWFLQGALIGACNCDWGCPCTFDAPPTYGDCEGMEMLVVREGRYGNVDLSGVVYGSASRFPGAVHEGNGTLIYVVDERATAPQRAALEVLFAGGGVGMPFEVFAAVATRLPTVYAPIAVEVAGIRSVVTVGDGTAYRLALSRIRNPVTGEEEEIYIDKPTGFTWRRGEMGMTTAMWLALPGLVFDHTGKYAEYAEFTYRGP